MTKVRKLKARKRYQYNVNRKRMNKKHVQGIESFTVKKAWNTRVSCRKNFNRLGLAYDVNKDIENINREGTTKVKTEPVAATNSFINELERDAALATAAAAVGKGFRYSQDEVNYLTYLLDKYGDDYEAMSRDKKNYLQHTWKQLKRKISVFKRIPDQYGEYLRNKENKSSS